MLPTIPDFTAPAAPASAVPQTPGIAASSSDEFYANVRKSVIAAAGECEQ